MTKCAVVTGATGRAGPLWVSELNDMGYSVFDLNLPEYDVSNLDSVRHFQKRLERRGCVPDVIVNNAAIDNPPGTDASFFGNFERILAVNLTGAVNVCNVFIPAMIKNGGGVIVNIGSVMGFIGADWRNYGGSFEKPVSYNVSKAALVQLSRSVTVQYGRHNIRCVTIAFGPLDVGLPEEFKAKFLKNVPLGRAISEDSWRAALRFAVQCPEFAGQAVLIDGGYVAW